MDATRPLTVFLRCPNRNCPGRLSHAIRAAGPERLACPVCDQPIPLDADGALIESRRLIRCPHCGGLEFFIRKDFPQKLGLALVVLFGLVASVFFYYGNVVATFATLASLVVVDAAIYLFVGKVTVCYRCRAEYRGFAYNPDHTGFDLATSEKYD